MRDKQFVKDLICLLFNSFIASTDPIDRALYHGGMMALCSFVPEDFPESSRLNDLEYASLRERLKGQEVLSYQDIINTAEESALDVI